MPDMAKRKTPAPAPERRTRAANGLERHRFTARLPDELFTWLEKCADRSGTTIAVELASVLDYAKGKGYGRP